MIQSKFMCGLNQLMGLVNAHIFFSDCGTWCCGGNWSLDFADIAKCIDKFFSEKEWDAVLVFWGFEYTFGSWKCL